MTNVYADVNAVLTPGWHLPLFVTPAWTLSEHMFFDVQSNIKECKSHFKPLNFKCSVHVRTAVAWLKQCRYGVKLYPINQSIYTRKHQLLVKNIFIFLWMTVGVWNSIYKKYKCQNKDTNTRLAILTLLIFTIKRNSNNCINCM